MQISTNVVKCSGSGVQAQCACAHFGLSGHFGIAVGIFQQLLRVAFSRYAYVSVTFKNVN